MIQELIIDKKIAQLQFLTNDSTDGFSHYKQAEMAVMSGIRWVQFRTKETWTEEILENAYRIRNICHRHGAKLIINDNVKAVIDIDADGVHLGREDMSVKEARWHLGEEKIIGTSAHTIKAMVEIAPFKPDYIGLGPFTETATKKSLREVLGIYGYKNLMDIFREKGFEIPVIAIGGIKVTDVDLLMNTGIDGVAISSGINDSKDRKKTITDYLEVLKNRE